MKITTKCYEYIVIRVWFVDTPREQQESPDALGKIPKVGLTRESNNEILVGVYTLFYVYDSV